MDVTESLSATERTLAEIWAEVLKIDSVSAEDGFFDLGGDSLAAVDALLKIYDSFGVQFTVETIFSVATLRQLARMTDKAIAGGGQKTP